VLGFLIIEKFRPGKSDIRIHISSGQIDDLRRLNSGNLTGWGGVACRAVVESALGSTLCVGRVEVHLFRCISSVSVDYLRCHFGKEGSQTFGFDEALPGVSVLQPSPFCAQETQHPASSLLGPRCVVY